MTRIQIDSGYINVLENVSLPINLGIGDIKNYGSRSGGFTKFIEVDGDENNTKVLGLNFEIDLDDLTFDRNIKKECVIIQNGVPIFEGFIQLISVERLNKFSNSNYKKYKYRVYIFDEVAALFTTIGEKELGDLSFPELEHNFNRQTILDSWSNTEGYIYPIYPNTDSTIWTLNDFKPAMFEKNYFDKIFSNAGYTYTFDALSRSDIRMDKRIVPFNGKTGDDEITALLENPFRVIGKRDNFNFELLQANTNKTLTPGRFNTIEPMTFNNNCFDFGLNLIDLDENNQYSIANEVLTSLVGSPISWEFDIEYDYTIELRGRGGAQSDFDFQPVQWRAIFQQVPNVNGSRMDLKLSSIVQDKALSTSTTSLGDPLILDNDITVFSFNDSTVYGPGWTTFASGTNRSVGVIPNITTNTELITRFLVYGEYFDGNGDVIVPSNFVNITDLPFRFANVGDTGVDRTAIERKVSISNVVVRARPLLNKLTKNAVVNMDVFIPKSVKQIDLIKAVIKTYNLVLVRDPEDERNIIIKTRDDYYDSGEEWDWSDKFIEDLPNTLDFIPEKLSKKHILRYKEDNDVINEAYQDETLKTFGQLDYEIQNEYTKGEDVKEIIYSPTPNVNSVFGHALPSINPIEPDNNIRVLLNNGTGSNYPFNFYDEVDKHDNLSNFIQVPFHLRTSMFAEDDRNPVFTICFDEPGFLFHDRAQSSTPNNMYNLHYKRTFNQLDNGKILTGYFDLNENDIQKLSKTFNYKIFIKNNGWFFLNKVIDYNATEKGFTKVELITADDEIDISFRRIIKPVGPGVITPGGFRPVPGKVINDFNRRRIRDSNTINVGNGFADVIGIGNVVGGSSAFIRGDFNTSSLTRKSPFILGDLNVIEGGSSAFVLGNENKVSNKSFVVGDNNNVSTKAFVVGDDLDVNESGFYVSAERVSFTSDEISLRSGYINEGYIEDDYFKGGGLSIDENGISLENLKLKVIETDENIDVENVDVVLVDTTLQSVVINLLDVSDGVVYTIKDKSGNAFVNNIKVIGESGLIDGEPDYYIENDWEAIKVIRKSGNWFII